MKPPFAYFGGKSRLAPWIVSLMPAHRVYIEPFAGSAAVLFAKPPCQHEVINDAAGSVVNFFSVLRDHPEQLERAVALTPYARDEFDGCADYSNRRLDPVERARRWWVRSTQGFGQSPVNTGWSISLNQSVNRPSSLVNRIDRFGELAERLRTVFIENYDALDFIARYDSPDGVIYADPPYLDVTRTSFNDPVHGWRRRPDGDYEVEFNTEDEHRALAKTLSNARATVFLSGYPSALYDELYAGWYRIDRHVIVHSSNGIAKEPRPKKLEVIWSNRPIAEGKLFDPAQATA